MAPRSQLRLGSVILLCEVEAQSSRVVFHAFEFISDQASRAWRRFRAAAAPPFAGHFALRSVAASSILPVSNWSKCWYAPLARGNLLLRPEHVVRCISRPLTALPQPLKDTRMARMCCCVAGARTDIGGCLLPDATVPAMMYSQRSVVSQISFCCNHSGCPALAVLHGTLHSMQGSLGRLHEALQTKQGHALNASEHAQ